MQSRSCFQSFDLVINSLVSRVIRAGRHPPRAGAGLRGAARGGRARRGVLARLELRVGPSPAVAPAPPLRPSLRASGGSTCLLQPWAPGPAGVGPSRSHLRRPGDPRNKGDEVLLVAHRSSEGSLCITWRVWRDSGISHGVGHLRCISWGQGPRQLQAPSPYFTDERPVSCAPEEFETCGAEGGAGDGAGQAWCAGTLQAPPLALETHSQPRPALLGSRSQARGPSDPVPSTAARQAVGARRRGAGLSGGASSPWACGSSSFPSVADWRFIVRL